jgi:integrase/recombinase XerD
MELTSSQPIIALQPASAGASLTVERFGRLANVPPVLAEFVNIDNPRTCWVYQSDTRDFMGVAGVTDQAKFRDVAQAHVRAQRRSLELRALIGATIRRKLAALSSLFRYLCTANTTCYVSGWWQCSDGDERIKVEYGDLQYFDEGERMP